MGCLGWRVVSGHMPPCNDYCRIMDGRVPCVSPSLGRYLFVFPCLPTWEPHHIPGPASSGWQNRYPDVDLTLIIGTPGNSESMPALDSHPAERMALGPAGFPENRNPHLFSLCTWGQQENSNATVLFRIHPWYTSPALRSVPHYLI